MITRRDWLLTNDHLLLQNISSFSSSQFFFLKMLLKKNRFDFFSTLLSKFIDLEQLIPPMSTFLGTFFGISHKSTLFETFFEY